MALFWWYFFCYSVIVLKGTYANNPTSEAGNVPVTSPAVTDIHIIGFFPCTHPNDTKVIPVDNCDEIERIPVMKLALEEINQSSLLPGYRLVVDYANSNVRTSL